MKSDKLHDRMSGHKNPNFGKKHTIESLKKISEAHKGIPLSIDHKLKIGLSQKGKSLSLETKEKMSNSKKGTNHPYFGKTFSNTHKKKISLSITGNKNPSYNNTIYNFKHIDTNGIFHGTYYDFYTKYNFNKSGVGKLIHNKTKMYRGWIITE